VDAARGDIEGAIHNYERAQSIIPLVEYTGALEDLYTAAGLAGKAREQRELISTIETLGRATNEKTNRNLALTLADHNRDLGVALELMQTEIPVRGDVYTWDAYAWVLFRNGRLEEAKAASAMAVKLRTPEPCFYYHASKIALALGDQKSAREFSDRLRSLNARFDFAKTEMASAQIP
jgi:tetratricopeptide (TPR) repeat protein